MAPHRKMQPTPSAHPHRGLRSGRGPPRTLNLHIQNRRTSLATNGLARPRQGPHWLLSTPSRPPRHRLLHQGLALTSPVTPFHHYVSPLAREPSVIRLNPPSPALPCPSPAPRPTVTRVRDFLGVRARARTPGGGGVSFKRPNQRSRCLSLPLLLYSPASEPPILRGPHYDPRASPLADLPRAPLPNFSCFCPQIAGRERAPRTPRTLRGDVTGRGAALRGRGGVWPTDGYKRAAVRARPAQCGWALGAGGVLGAQRGGRRRQRGVERSCRGLPRAAAAAVGPPAPAGGPQSAGRGPGGPAPGRPQSW